MYFGFTLDGMKLHEQTYPWEDLKGQSPERTSSIPLHVLKKKDLKNDILETSYVNLIVLDRTKLSYIL